MCLRLEALELQLRIFIHELKQYIKACVGKVGMIRDYAFDNCQSSMIATILNTYDSLQNQTNISLHTPTIHDTFGRTVRRFHCLSA